ncbi:D-threo-aldose 1-dehydrogenase [Mycetocola sp. BIGb0189]|uniref:aldo/keto reductase n=1 Tax=Mycetocola sp. BIGb0189 TaxID=2940604 RepID=UPI00216997BD|nr:aldo/keto reductase [Mycetocola sp. BIGb0189]MCS4277527.1 D-threo-aldose 1-dehydrogenase [Mycetocola sp. BIGb0189]
MTTEPTKRVTFPQARGLALGATSLIHHADPQANSDDLVDAAWDAGIRYFDTAPMYGGGASEKLFGPSLTRYPREEYVLSSKVGRLVRDGEPVLEHEDALWRYDFSADGIRRSVDASLARLGVDRLDIAYIHDPDRFYDQASTESYAALQELRAEGVIGAIGVGITQAPMLARFLREIELDAALLAGRFSLVDSEALDEVIPLVREQGVTLSIASTLHAGLVDGKDSGHFHYQPTPPAIVERVAAIHALSERYGVPIGAVAIQYVLGYPEVDMILTGVADRGQLNQNLSWASWEIPAELWAELDASGLVSAPIPTTLLHP